MSDRIPVIIDGDFGVDEAFSLLMLSENPEVKLSGITTVFGCSPVENCTANALRLCELLNLRVPVAEGQAAPIMKNGRKYADPRGAFLNGKDGLGGKSYMLGEPQRVAKLMPAADFIARVASDEKKITILTSGPLTNIAAFILSYPELTDRIDGIAMAGGSAYGGDVRPAGEANISADPEAARIVFSSGIRIVMFGLETAEDASLSKDDREMVRVVGGKTGGFYYELLKSYSEAQERISDSRRTVLQGAIPAAWLSNQDLAQIVPCRVSIDLDGQYTRGCTVTDYMCVNGGPNAFSAVKLDRTVFVRTLLDSFRTACNRNG